MASNSTERSAIADRLRWAREQAGLSQGQVARLLGMHRPTISDLESGKRGLKADEVSQFTDIYDVRSQWLLGDPSTPDEEGDPRVEMAARELRKLKSEDLDTILRLVSALRSNEE